MASVLLARKGTIPAYQIDAILSAKVGSAEREKNVLLEGLILAQEEILQKAAQIRSQKISSSATYQFSQPFLLLLAILSIEGAENPCEKPLRWAGCAGEEVYPTVDIPFHRSVNRLYGLLNMSNLLRFEGVEFISNSIRRDGIRSGFWPVNISRSGIFALPHQWNPRSSLLDDAVQNIQESVPTFLSVQIRQHFVNLCNAIAPVGM